MANSGSVERYDGNEHVVDGFVGADENGVIPYQVGDKTYYISGITAEAKGTDAGDYPTQASGTPIVKDADGNDVSDQFDVTVTPGKLTIKKAEVTLKSADLSKPYDGKALMNGSTAMAVESGWATGEGAVYNFTGSQTLVGSSANTYTYTLLENTKASNYNITESTGTLTVTNRDAADLLKVQITAKSGEDTYDGTEKSVSGFENETDKGVAVEAGGETYYVTGYTSEAKTTDATSGDGIATTITGSPVVKDKDGNDVTAQFAVVPSAGKLIVHKRELKLRSDDVTKAYDGKPLTNGDTPLAVEEGWAEGDGAAYSFTASRTRVGTTPNDFTINPKNEGTKLDNYDIKQNSGQLTVTNRDAKYVVEIQGKSDEVTYDGATHTVSGFENETDKGVEVTVEGETYYVTGFTSTKSARTVSDSGSTIVSGEPHVFDAEGEEVTDQFTVIAHPGTLKIGKRHITLTSEDKSKVYDGYPLTGDGSEITVGGDGLAPGEVLDFTFTGSQTLAGSSPNSFTYRMGTVGGQIAEDQDSEDTGFFGFGMVVHAAELDEASAAGGDLNNYEIEVIYGKLTVTASGTPGGDGEDPTDVDPSKVVTKTHESGIYAIGQEVTFTVKATNIYADARTITLIEQDGVTLDQNIFEGVAGGETVTTTAHYTVTVTRQAARATRTTSRLRSPVRQEMEKTHSRDVTLRRRMRSSLRKPILPLP